MKNNIKLSKIRSLESSERNVSMVSLSDSKGLKAFLVKYGWRIIRLSTNPKGPVTNRMKMIMNFGDMLIKMNKHHGPTYTVK